MRPIDADALHAKIYEDSERSYGATANIAQVLLRIENAPTIEAKQVRHGRWSVKMLDIGGGDKIRMIQCSECNKYANMKFDYCPNCGAKMGEGE